MNCMSELYERIGANFYGGVLGSTIIIMLYFQTQVHRTYNKIYTRYTKT